MDPATAYMAAGAISGGSSVLGQLSANRSNRKEAKRNREFQAMMSSTAHQREVWDLELAGLNPILSAGGKGASSPSGAQANIQSIGEGVGKGLSSAAEAALVKGNVKTVEANADKAEADADSAKSVAQVNAERARRAAEIVDNETAPTNPWRSMEKYGFDWLTKAGKNVAHGAKTLFDWNRELENKLQGMGYTVNKDGTVVPSYPPRAIVERKADGTGPGRIIRITKKAARKRKKTRSKRPFRK